jgi:hypothetical protein
MQTGRVANLKPICAESPSTPEAMPPYGGSSLISLAEVWCVTLMTPPGARDRPQFGRSRQA